MQFHSAAHDLGAQSLRRRYEAIVPPTRRPPDPLTADCRVARVAATPLALAPDYHRYLEPIKCEEVDPLPRLPHARAIARVGRQVILVFSLSRA